MGSCSTWRSTEGAKVRWLIDNQSLWSSFPDCDPHTRMPRRCRPYCEPDPMRLCKRWTVLVSLMKDAGLVGSRTWAGDVRLPAYICICRRRLARSTRLRPGQDPSTMENTMSKTPQTHDDRITALEALTIALASDLLATVQRSRLVAGHTESLPAYLAALRERGEREATTAK
jgi:hypothetical protein